MDPDCPDCGGSGEEDSGGQHPWGEWINIPCSTCWWVNQKYIPLRMHDITPDSPLGHWIEIPCPYCHGYCQCRYVGRDNDEIVEECTDCDNGLVWYDSGPFREINND